MSTEARKKELSLLVPPGAPPPYDPDAELGMIHVAMGRPSLAEEMVALVRPDDLYEEPNRRLWAAICELVKEGKAPDVIQVKARIRTKKEANLVDASIFDKVANCGASFSLALDYCQIVAGKARMYRILSALHQCVAEGYCGNSDAEEFAQTVASRVESVTGLGTGDEAPVWLFDTVRQEMANFAKGGGKQDKPMMVTGLTKLDERLIMREGHLVIVAGRPGMGKAQSVDELIMTPMGPRRMGDLAIGDLVTGADGKPTRVTNVFERGRLELFRVTFDDGTFTSCCDDHLWLTRTRAERRKGVPGSVRTMRDIRATLQRAGGGRNHSIPYCGAIEFEAGEALPIPAYVLGAWLGDGSTSGNTVRLHNSENDVKEMFVDGLCENDTTTLQHRRVTSCGATSGDTLTVRRVRKANAPSHTSSALGALGLLGAKSHTKFIPKAYLRASIDDRVALLRGLMDTDGHVDDTGTSIDYSTASDALAKDVVDLVRGLGGSVSVTTRESSYVKDGVTHGCKPSHRLRITFPTGNIVPVSSEKHLARWRPGPSRVSERFMVSVESVGTAICRCITVDAADRLYVTEQGIVTHNSALAGQVALATGNTLFVSLEMPNGELGRRSVAARVGMSFIKALQRGPADQDVGAKMNAAFVEIKKSGVQVVDKPSLTLAQVAAYCRHTNRELEKAGLGRLRAVVVDYLQLMTDPDVARRGNREAEIAAISRGLKALAKRMKITVMALSQLSREAEAKEGGRPQLKHLRESGAIEQDADKIIFPYRQNYYDKKDLGDVEPCEIIIAKDRQNGPGMVQVGWRGSATVFEDLADEEVTPNW